MFTGDPHWIKVVISRLSVMSGKKSWLMGLANIYDYQMVIGCQGKHLGQSLLIKKTNQSLTIRAVLSSQVYADRTRHGCGGYSA
jgi:hypothetical protein